MNINELTLYHFRNYTQSSFSFSSNCIHILAGQNAQGKTNIVEAIYFLAHLRSFRTSSLSNLIQNGEESFILEAEVESLERTEKLKTVVAEKKKNLYRFNNPVHTYSSFVGLCNAILFCPDDMMLFASGPKERRKFIDMELAKLDPKYTSSLSSYQKLLKLKNAALKMERIDKSLVDIYTSQMIELQEYLIPARAEFIAQISLKANELYPFFCEKKEEIELEYKTFVNLDSNLNESLKQICASVREKEFFSRTSAVGVHKDDVIFKLNARPVLEAASQGQKRSLLLSVKLALAQIIFEKSGQYPILLLDDVFSELDSTRKKQLLEKLPLNMQIFITTTEEPDLSVFDRAVKLYHVEDGSLSLKEARDE
jgi:DNA replication and repair protein RecF